ncbi:MAG: hypothetical protein IKI69_04095 [Oscillospiraceae bacterium]|nr:hypothetical protein [Oscillospiraceae bacterium]
MNRDIFLWIAIAGLAAIICILSISLSKSKRRLNTDQDDELDVELDPSELVDEDTIVQISNEIAFTVVLVNKTWVQVSKKIRLFIYPYVYLHSFIAENKWGEYSDQFVIDMIFSALKEEKNNDQFDSVMHMMVLLRLLAFSKNAAHPGKKEDDKYIYSVIHYQDLIDDTICEGIFFFTREADEIADEYGVTEEDAERILAAEKDYFIDTHNMRNFVDGMVIPAINMILDNEIDKLVKYVKEDVLTRK